MRSPFSPILGFLLVVRVAATVYDLNLTGRATSPPPLFDPDSSLSPLPIVIDLPPSPSSSSLADTPRSSTPSAESPRHDQWKTTSEFLALTAQASQDATEVQRRLELLPETARPASSIYQESLRADILLYRTISVSHAVQHARRAIDMLALSTRSRGSIILEVTCGEKVLKMGREQVDDEHLLIVTDAAIRSLTAQMEQSLCSQQIRLLEESEEPLSFDQVAMFEYLKRRRTIAEEDNRELKALLLEMMHFISGTLPTLCDALSGEEQDDCYVRNTSHFTHSFAPNLGNLLSDLVDSDDAKSVVSFK